MALVIILIFFFLLNIISIFIDNKWEKVILIFAYFVLPMCILIFSDLDVNSEKMISSYSNFAWSFVIQFGAGVVYLNSQYSRFEIESRKKTIKKISHLSFFSIINTLIFFLLIIIFPVRDQFHKAIRFCVSDERISFLAGRYDDLVLFYILAISMAALPIGLYCLFLSTRPKE